jgi:hypothetical protein
VLAVYEGRPGQNAGAQASSWPPVAGLELANAPARTLVMFIHPHCPCSSASINELAVLSGQAKALKTYVVFEPENGFAPGWEKTPLWQQAATIPGVISLIDEKSKIASRFSAHTSGETMLYDSAGQLLFEGGITGSRGHEGDNLGLCTIEALVDGQLLSGQPRKTEVFGCALND